MRLLGILGVAGSGLRANQVAIRTAGHNISNVNTDGYSRQRVTFVPVSPQPAARGFQLGGGVLATDLRGLRDEFVERQLIVEKGFLGAAKTRQRPLQRMDALFNEMNGEGIHRSMERFFNDLRDLHANAESLDHRAGVRAAGEIFTERIRNTATALKELKLSLNINISD
jgi:flagellar hook-associated protein 1 FlgK